MLKVDIIANTPSLKNFSSFQQKVYNTVQILSIKLTNKIKNDKLTGQVLKVQTGRLRNSIKSQVSQTGNLVTATVGTNVKYAGVHEYGFRGNITIRAHLREIKQAFGKQITPRTIQVGTHTRSVVFPQRSFLRSTLADMKTQIHNDIRNSIRN